MRKGTCISIMFTLIVANGCRTIPSSTFSGAKSYTVVDSQCLSGDNPIYSRPDVGQFVVHEPAGSEAISFSITKDNVQPALQKSEIMNRIVFVQPASIIDTPEIILPSDSSSITATEPQIILIDAKRAYLFSRITVLLCIIPGGILLTPVSLIISAIYYKRAKMEIEKNPGTYSNADQLSYVRNILVGFLIGFICAILIIGALVLLNS